MSSMAPPSPSAVLMCLPAYGTAFCVQNWWRESPSVTPRGVVRRVVYHPRAELLLGLDVEL